MRISTLFPWLLIGLWAIDKVWSRYERREKSDDGYVSQEWVADFGRKEGRLQ